MTDLTIRPDTGDPAVSDDDGLAHWTCCEHPHRALCGAPLNAPLIDLGDDEDPDCIVCDDLTRCNVCPVYGSCLVIE